MLKKVEIIYPTIERPEVLSVMLKCLKACEKPKDIRILAIVQASKGYKDRVEDGLRKIFENVRVVHLDEQGIDHIELGKAFKGNEEGWKENQKQIEKLEKLYRTYQNAVDNASRDVDYFWLMQDDQPFPPDTYPHFRKMIADTGGDIAAGVSFSWRNEEGMNHNFWEIEEGQTPDEENLAFPRIRLPIQEKGIIRIGATGLSNLLCKKDCFLNWKPVYDPKKNWGGDVSFFVNAWKQGYKAFGDWGHPIPHMTKNEEGEIRVLGRIKKNLVPIMFE